MWTPLPGCLEHFPVRWLRWMLNYCTAPDAFHHHGRSSAVNLAPFFSLLLMRSIARRDMLSSSTRAVSAPCTRASTGGGAWWPNGYDKTYPSPNEKRPWPICGQSMTASDLCPTQTSSTSTACGEKSEAAPGILRQRSFKHARTETLATQNTEPSSRLACRNAVLCKAPPYFSGWGSQVRL